MNYSYCSAFGTSADERSQGFQSSCFMLSQCVSQGSVCLKCQGKQSQRCRILFCAPNNLTGLLTRYSHLSRCSLPSVARPVETNKQKGYSFIMPWRGRERDYGSVTGDGVCDSVVEYLLCIAERPRFSSRHLQ